MAGLEVCSVPCDRNTTTHHRVARRRNGRSSILSCNPTKSDWRADIRQLDPPLFKLTQINLHQEQIQNTTTGGNKNCLPSIEKYWKQRYLLFSKFDQGIKMDVEGWFSATPEAIAEHQAKRCGGGTVVELFTGVGGNLIHFAKQSRRVIAVDIDPLKIHYAKENAAIYGVDSGRIQFLLGDAMILGPKLAADVVFMAPPWGGPDYSKQKTFDVNTMLKPCGAQTLFDMAKKIAPKVVMMLPRNADVNQLKRVAQSANPPWALEVEKNYLNGKFISITAYFTDPAILV